MSSNIEQLRARISAALAPCEVRVRDDSSAHEGHAHAGEASHLAVRVISGRFRGLKVLERHRLVYTAAGDLLTGPLHALQIHAQTPEEAAGNPD